MTRFDRYVLSQLLLLFGFFALVLVSVYWINRAVLLFDHLIADGQSAGTFLQLTLLTLPNVIRMVLPIAAFVAAVYVTNRLTVESELVVAQAVGMSPWRLARPVVAFGLIVALLMGALVHVLVPQSRIALADREREIETNVTARLLTEGRFLHPAPGVTFFIREITPEGEMRNVFLSDAREPGRRTTYMAARAFLVRPDVATRVASETGTGTGTGTEPGTEARSETRSETGSETGTAAGAGRVAGAVLAMFDGAAQVYDLETRQLSSTVFESFSYDVAALIEGGGRSRRDVREYPTPVLFAPDETALAETRRPPASFYYEGHLRMVQPFTPLIAALVGFATLQLGGFSRFGVWRQIGVAIVLIIAVQVAENAVADAARRDPALWPLIYAPFLGGLAAALALLWGAAQPGRLARRPRGADAREAARA